MTWGELKLRVESEGITDSTKIAYIDIGMGRVDTIIIKVEGDEAIVYD